MKYKNADDLEWIPWYRYALLLRIDGKQVISLGRFRLSISANKDRVRLDVLKGYKTRVIDTKESDFKSFNTAFAAPGYKE